LPAPPTKGGAGSFLGIENCWIAFAKSNRTGQPGRHPIAGHVLDYYQTPPYATLALLFAEKLPHRLWEPCVAGGGAMVRVLRDAGHHVVASDIIARDFPLDSVVDFFDAAAPLGCEAIVTNPPYRLAAKMVGRALHLVPQVCFLLRLAFLESECRTPILEDGTLARVHVFRKRFMMHRDGWTGPRASSQIALAWFVWEREHTGLATIDRISWDERPDLFGGRS
jgi:hypothetical protein